MDGDKDKTNVMSPSSTKKEGVKQEKGVIKKECTIKSEKEREAQRLKEAKIAESELVRDLKAQLK